MASNIRERVKIGEFNDDVERGSIVRYQFARQFCIGKNVADIACGTGYGLHILREVAKEVDGYDKEELCGNYIIDLEKEGWDKKYNVIVSFETIEHLANPEFFLANIKRTADLLIISTPIGERRGDNPFHKQTWGLNEFKALFERSFDCQYQFQLGGQFSFAPSPSCYLIGICRPK